MSTRRPFAERDLPFWAGCRDGRLTVPHCPACDAHWFPSQDRCPSCGSPEVGWTDVGPEGVVYTFAVVRGPRSDGIGAPSDVRYPYVLAVVEVGGAARIAAALVDVDPDSVAIGMPVRARFTPGVAELPVFHPLEPQIA
jgi:uncharacterized OB-fold protein